MGNFFSHLVGYGANQILNIGWLAVKTQRA